MMEDRLQARISRGHKAHAELQETRQAFAELEAELMKIWRATRDRDERDRIWHTVNTLEKVQDILVRRATDGRMAESELADLISGPQKAA